jgi:ABC-type sugar transport system ATPase subunit
MNSRQQMAPAPLEPLLRVIKGSKVYGGAHALQDVDFDIARGEIHGLVGENGAGKSTLCKAFAGAITLTSGELLLDGVPQTFHTPADALKAGVIMVYQETSLIPTMTVAQNILLGQEDYLTRLRGMYIGAQQLLQSMNFHVDPTAMVSTLGAAQKQMVEIARAVRHGARLIIFDEPTATLGRVDEFSLDDVFGIPLRNQA